MLAFGVDVGLVLRERHQCVGEAGIWAGGSSGVDKGAGGIGGLGSDGVDMDVMPRSCCNRCSWSDENMGNFCLCGAVFLPGFPDVFPPYAKNCCCRCCCEKTGKAETFRCLDACFRRSFPRGFSHCFLNRSQRPCNDNGSTLTSIGRAETFGA